MMFNLELASIHDKQFYNVRDHSTSRLRDLRHAQLDAGIYYKPTAFPLLDHTDTTLGSAFKDYRVPTSAYQFSAAGLVKRDRKQISLAAYVDACDQLFRQAVIQIYRQHGSAVLSYSGGIDSMVLLGYIESLGLMSRTTLLIQENYAQAEDDPSLIRNNARKALAIRELTQRVAAEQIVHQSVTDQHVIDCFNRYDYHALRTYNTVAGMELFRDRAMIYGHHGNQVLLHKDIFLQEIVLQGGATLEQVNNLLKDNHYYCSSMRELTGLVSLDDQNLKHRQWHTHNDNYYYDPLGAAIDLCRCVDYAVVDPLTIMDVGVGRELLHRTVGNKFDDLIVTEGLSDGDSLPRKSFDRDCFDAAQLEIPIDIHHDTEGVRWLESQLDQQRIDFNSLTSIKMCCMLSKSYWKVAQR